MKKSINIIPAIILFIEGFYGLAYQMLVIRQLTPYVGSSIDVISWIVGVFLIFLAISYKIGGNTQNNLDNKLKFNFITAAIISTITLSGIFLDFLFSSLGLVFGNYITMIVYLFLFLAPTVFLFGQTVPIITNKFKEGTVSSISGNVLFLSTIGSFLGSIISTNLLMKFFGINFTIMISNILLISSLFFIFNKQKKEILSICFCIIFISLFSFLNIKNYTATTPYANYEIRKINMTQNKNTYSGIVLSSNFSLSSILLENGKTMGYIKYIQDKLFLDLNLKKADFLIIGAGGFVFSENIKLNDNLKFTYLDIDPEIKLIAEKEFLKHPIKGEFIAQDGRYFLSTTKRQFDITILDAFSSANSIPQSLYTIESLTSIKNKTKENGWVIINTIADTSFSSHFSQKIYNTILSVFGFCYIENIDFGMKKSNIIYFCKNNSNKNNNLEVYFDDKNNANSDFKNM